MSTYNVEAILSQDDWLRRMARSLVQDPHTADDLVQEAWLADLQGGGAARDKRSWLSVVMYRAGSKTFRTRRNQRERAESSAYLRETEVPATDEVVGDRQLRSLVAEELLALPEPQRTALHLVYVADLSVTEAGRRMGVAKSTASQRVDRGLEMMRQRIDSAYDGDRRTWCLALLPWARMEAAARKAPAVFSVPGLAAAIAVLAASALALGWAWRAWGPAGAPPATVVPIPSVAAAAPAAPLPALPTAEPARASVAAPVSSAVLDTTARISARFVDSDGDAVASGSWSLTGRRRRAEAQGGEGTTGDEVEWEDLSGELDADGNLDVTFEVPLNHFFGLTVMAPGYAKTSWGFRAIGRGDDKRLGTLALEPGLTLRGRIVTPAGEPLDDRMWGVTAVAAPANEMLERSDTRVFKLVEEGQASFELTGLPAGEVSVTFQSGGQRTREPQVVTMAAGGTELQTFTVDLGETVSSTLKFSVDPRMGPIEPPLAPSDFYATAADGSVLEVVQRGSGRTRFEVLNAAPTPISLSLADPRFEPWAAEISDTGRIKSVQLVGSASLELNVLDGAGSPVDLYSVAFAPVLKPGEFNSYERPIHSGRDALPGGLVEQVIPGSFRLIVRGSMGESEMIIDDLQPGERRVLSVTLAPNSRIAGTVTYSGGDPAMGVEVYLVRPAEVDDSSASMVMLGGGAGYGGEEWRMSVAETRSGGDGAFDLELPDAGSYYVMASRPNRPWVFSDLRTSENHGEPVHLELPRGATLEGTIVLPEHLPKSGWAVFLGVADPRLGGPTGWQAPELDIDGKFHVEGVPAGDLVVALTRERMRSWSETGTPPVRSFVIGHVDLVDGQVHEETFSFINGVPAVVTAELPQGEGLDGQVSVSFYRATGDGPEFKGGIKGTVGDLGTCFLEPGSYVAGVAQAGAAVLNGPVLTVPEVAAHTVPIGVSVTEKRVRVFSEGTPLASQSLEFRSAQGPRARFKTDSAGWLTVRLDTGPLKARWRMMQCELNWPPTSDELRLENALND